MPTTDRSPSFYYLRQPRSTSARSLNVLTLLLAVFLALPGNSQEEDDQNDIVDAQSGLLARFTSSAGEDVTRVVDRVVLSDGYVPLDDRLMHGIRSVRYEGLLYAELTETFVISAHVRGRLRVDLGGERVIDVNHDDARWVDGAPLELDFGHHRLVVDYTPPDEGAEIALCWSAPHFTTETITPRWLSHTESSHAQERHEAGRRLTRVLRCGACHDVPRVAAPLSAPSLERVASNIDPDWLVNWLGNNDQKDEQGGRVMPHFDLTAGEARDVAAALLTGTGLETEAQKPPSPHPSSEDGGGGEVTVTRAQGERMFVALGLCGVSSRRRGRTP